MKTRLLMTITMIIGFSALALTFLIYETPSKTNLSDNRESLKEVVYSSTSCANYWRVELFAMWKNQTYDYKNDPIFIECSDALESEPEPKPTAKSVPSNGIFFDSYDNSYYVGQEIGFKITWVDIRCEELFEPIIVNYDHSQIIWNASAIPQCKTIEGKKVSTFTFPIGNTITIDEIGQYRVVVPTSLGPSMSEIFSVVDNKDLN